MQIEKNNVQYNIKNPIQLSAFLSSGWKKVGDDSTEESESSTDLSTLTKDQLIELAKEKELDISGVKTKDQLISLIEKA